MKKISPLRPSQWLLLALLAVTLLLKNLPDAGEWYATHLYPGISYLLSCVASMVPYSLTELAVILGGGFILVYLPYCLCRRRGWHGLWVVTQILVLYYVWFYLGWGLNYSRCNFYQRMAVTPVEADTTQFLAFLDEYTSQLEQTYVNIEDLDREMVIEEVRRLYAEVAPAEAALCQPQTWQQPKRSLVNRLYSANGVLGFMGPFFCESHVNHSIMDEEFPFTFAHEYAHLMGISSEAEANYWAYYICTRSRVPEICYSGYYGLLPNVRSNLQAFMTYDEIQAWWLGLNPHIRWTYRRDRVFWQQLRIAWIDELQTYFYNLFLKSNGIPSGLANYNQVIQMVMSAQEKG